MNVSIPTKRPANPVEGQLRYDANVCKHEVYLGTNFNWVYFDELGPIYNCVICKADLFSHTDKGHPFCKDNLVYLEWKACDVK